MTQANNNISLHTPQSEHLVKNHYVSGNSNQTASNKNMKKPPAMGSWRSVIRHTVVRFELLHFQENDKAREEAHNKQAHNSHRFL
jgi:hypothetical protein